MVKNIIHLILLNNLLTQYLVFFTLKIHLLNPKLKKNQIILKYCFDSYILEFKMRYNRNIFFK